MGVSGCGRTIHPRVTTPRAPPRERARDEKTRKRNETKIFIVDRSQRIAWTVRDGTDASFEMDPWDRARTPKKYTSSSACTHRSTTTDGHRTDERTNEEFHWNGYPHRRETKVSLDAPLDATRARHPRDAPWCGLTLKTSSAVLCVRIVLVVVVVTADVDPFDRSNGNVDFVSSLRVAVVDRVSCVPRACAARLGKADRRFGASKASNARERIGRVVYHSVYPYVLVWVQVFGFGNDGQSNISIWVKINNPIARVRAVV